MEIETRTVLFEKVQYISERTVTYEELMTTLEIEDNHRKRYQQYCITPYYCISLKSINEFKNLFPYKNQKKIILYFRYNKIQI